MALKKAFFDYVRTYIFGVNHMVMSQSDVDCMNELSDEFDDYRESYLSHTDKYYLPYILATAFHEARFEYYIREIGRGKTKRYGRPDPVTGYIYYGRGLSQLTWKENYEKLSPVVGIDLVANPDRALEKDASCKILIVGIMQGLFTGHSLPSIGNTLAVSTHSPHELFKAFRVAVNGRDCDELIANYADVFMKALAIPETTTEKVAAPTVVSPKTAPTEDGNIMGKLFLSPALAGSLLHLAFDYGPKVASLATKGISNSDDIRNKASDMIARLKSFDFDGAVVDLNAILADFDLSQDDLRNLVHTARLSPPVPNATQ